MILKTKYSVHLYRRGFIKYILLNLIQFLILSLTFWFNYKFIDGNNFLDATVFICFLSLICNYGFIKSYKEISKEKLDKIEKILETK